MGGPARPLHEPGNHRSSERCSHRHSADRGSLIGQPTLLRITAPTPRPGARSPTTTIRSAGWPLKRIYALVLRSLEASAAANGIAAQRAPRRLNHGAYFLLGNR